MADDRPVVLYDRDCGFCRWTLAKLLAWDRGHKLRPIAIQDPEAEPYLAGMADEKRLGSWHFAGPGEETLSAGAAFVPLFKILPGARPLSWLAARAPGLTERGYRLLADNRSRLGPRIPDSAKRRADRRIEARRKG